MPKNNKKKAQKETKDPYKLKVYFPSYSSQIMIFVVRT